MNKVSISKTMSKMSASLNLIASNLLAGKYKNRADLLKAQKSVNAALKSSKSAHSVLVKPTLSGRKGLAATANKTFDAKITAVATCQLQAQMLKNAITAELEELEENQVDETIEVVDFQAEEEVAAPVVEQNDTPATPVADQAVEDTPAAPVVDAPANPDSDAELDQDLVLDLEDVDDDIELAEFFDDDQGDQEVDNKEAEAAKSKGGKSLIDPDKMKKVVKSKAAKRSDKTAKKAIRQTLKKSNTIASGANLESIWDFTN